MYPINIGSLEFSSAPSASLVDETPRGSPASSNPYLSMRGFSTLCRPGPRYSIHWRRHAHAFRASPSFPSFIHSPACMTCRQSSLFLQLPKLHKEYPTLLPARTPLLAAAIRCNQISECQYKRARARAVRYQKNGHYIVGAPRFLMWGVVPPLDRA